jgi:PKD repeat protein
MKIMKKPFSKIFSGLRLITSVPFINPKPAFAQAEDLTIGNYQLVSKKRSGRTTYDFAFRADITNTGTEDALSVSADLTSLVSTTTVIEGHLTFGDITVGATATSTDTFTIRINRRYPYNEANLSWIIDATFAGGGSDDDGDGYIAVQTGGDDCDDTNPNIHPGAAELWNNGLDDDCDGVEAIDNTAPNINITAPFDGQLIGDTTPNITMTFSDSVSGIDTNSFSAQINGVESSSLFTANGTGANYQTTTDLPVGNNVVTASISDNAGNSSGATSNFTIAILRAIPGANPTSGGSPLTVHFTTDGEDPAGTIEVFRWDYDGNGTWDTYDTVSRDYNYTYQNAGVYNAILYVQSSTGKTATASIQITVQNNPPIATADVQPSNGPIPLTVQMTGSGTDTDGSVVLYEWDFDGDGAFDFSSPSSGNTAHTYTTEGTHNAVFRVTDNIGQTATAVAVTTAVLAGPVGSPTAIAWASPTSGNAPLNVNFNGTSPDPDIVLYEWDFEDDGVFDYSSTTTGNTSHTYTTSGTHVAAFRVTDSTGLTGVDKILISVNLQVSLAISNDTVGFLPSTNGMTASASSQYSSSSTYLASNAVDGNTVTYWLSGYRQTPAYGVNLWFEVVFDNLQKVSNLTMVWYSSTYRMSRANIELYDDNDVIVHSLVTDLTGNTSQVSIPDVINVKKIRLEAINTAYPYYVVLREFVVQSTPMSTGGQPTASGTNINTYISADTQVSVYIKDANGNRVRTLVNNVTRPLGTYHDYWDVTDDNGVLVNSGLYYAVLEYLDNGQVWTYDLTNSTGGTRYSFPISSGCDARSSWVSNFSPFDDDLLDLKFTLCSAQEVTAFIGPLWSGADQTRIRTILNRKPFPKGTHTIYWDGLDDYGNEAQQPPGDSLITGFWRYSLPDNAIFATIGTAEITAISADPNYFSPFSEKCDSNGNDEGVTVNYDVSEDVARVELRVYSTRTGSLLRTSAQNSVQAGSNAIFWDGKNNNGEYVDIGDYQVGVVAIDAQGNESMLRYTLVRVDY